MKDATKPERDFFQLLETLGSITSTQLNEFVINLYFEALNPFGLDKVNKVLMAYMMDLDQYGKMPTIRAIKIKLGVVAVSKELQSKEVSAKILSAISKFGYTVSVNDTKIDDIKKYVGDIGWKVIDLQGGWNAICESVTNANKSTYQAQWRDLALSVLESKREKPFELPKSSDEKISGLITDISQACTMRNP